VSKPELPLQTTSPTLVPKNYVQVAVPVPMRQLFTYLVPEDMQQQPMHIGERVAVSFGARQVIAVVVSVSNECDIDAKKVKPISKRLNDTFHLSDSLVAFLTLCANYYHHPIGDVFQQALPKLLRQVKKIDIQPPMVWHSEKITDITQKQLEKVATKAPKQYALYQLIEKHQGISWAELRTLGYSKAQLKALTAKALITEVKQQPCQFVWQEQALAQENKQVLSTEQAIIVAAINQSLEQFTCHLIDGVTGSGKTEVYLQAMENVLANNQQVLVVVPEIGLTPQTLLRFEQRFNVPICLHHSNLNDTERLDTWLNAQQSSAAIIIGTRSAIFSPLHRLGMIIVDEEHDSSLKQQDSFRYHGRDMAILRARQLNIPIVLGSATPSFESLQNALSGKYQYHQLQKRAGKSRKAKIALIDVAKQQMEFGPFW